MRRILARLFIFLLLLGGLYLVWPWGQKARLYAELMHSPAPTALPNPLPGRWLTDTWGAARSGGRKHEGIDIFAPRGTPIRATTRGILLIKGPNTLGGRTVTVLGPGGQRHYYAHLERYPALKVGDVVQAGEVVGYVGDSGNAKGTPTHLHYGISSNGKAMNPYPLLKAWRP